MKLRLLVVVTAVAACAALAGAAFARNPHCAGGIQYVVQGLRDKEKGNTEDYQREMNKAVDQLATCATEDPEDFEAQSYLGWAYAEIDSMGPAGEWFTKAATAAAAKGDKRKIEFIAANRDHYWSMAYNDGIKNIQEAQSAYPDFTKAPTEDEKPLKEQAAKNYQTAVTKLTQAKLLKPGHAQTLRNLATAYALMGNYDAAETVLRNGVTEAAADTAVHGLSEALRTVRANKAGALLGANKFDDAITYYSDLVKQDPTNSELFMGLGNAYFSRAGTKPDAEKKGDFKLAADAYAKAFELKTSDTNLAFNAALSYQNAGELALAEGQWRAVLKNTPNDPDALSSLGSVLADEKKYADAQTVLLRAIEIKPEEKVYYRQLGAVYSKANNNAKTTEMLIVYMAMSKGAPAADPAAATKAVKAGTAAASTLSSMGTPDKVLEWDDTSGGGKLQTWLYAKKRVAFTYNTAGALVQKSDWSAPAKL